MPLSARSSGVPLNGQETSVLPEIAPPRDDAAANRNASATRASLTPGNTANTTAGAVERRANIAFLLSPRPLEADMRGRRSIARILERERSEKV